MREVFLRCSFYSFSRLVSCRTIVEGLKNLLVKYFLTESFYQSLYPHSFLQIEEEVNCSDLAHFVIGHLVLVYKSAVGYFLALEKSAVEEFLELKQYYLSLLLTLLDLFLCIVMVNLHMVIDFLCSFIDNVEENEGDKKIDEEDLLKKVSEQDKEHISEKYQKYSQMDNNQLMSEFLNMSRQRMAEGNLDSSEVQRIKDTLFPYLSVEQKEKFKDLMDLIGR